MEGGGGSGGWDNGDDDGSNVLSQHKVDTEGHCRQSRPWSMVMLYPCAFR